METTEITFFSRDSVILKGNLRIPEQPIGLVIFSHGSGSSRLSPRNNFVAQALNREGFATLLTDLLTEGEEDVVENRFDITLLTSRLLDVTESIIKRPELSDLPVGYFGASTGAASALAASAQSGDRINAVVSRGGRPDLAELFLDKVKSPTLLIVGSLDYQVIEMNESAFAGLKCKKKIEIVKGATHLFEEPGKLAEVARLANSWYKKHLLKKVLKPIGN